MVIVAWLDTFPVRSLTVYEIGVGSCVKPACGVKGTLPELSTLQVPWPATVRVVCRPGVAGSRSTVLGSRSKLGSVSLSVTFKVTGPAGLCSELSLTATGGWDGTPGVRVTEA